MVIGQAAKRRGEQESSEEVPPQRAVQPSSPTSEFSPPSLLTPAASTVTSPPGPAVPSGRAALLATLRERERNKQSREAAPHPPASALGSPAAPSTGPLPSGLEGRARLLETLRVKSRQQQQQAPASSGVSAPTSSPPASTTSPSAGESLALDTGFPVPPSREEKVVEEERGVTQMTGGLEWLKMGEKADAPPVVMKGSAGTTSKLGTNYIRLELAQGKDMWEYEVKFSPSVDSKDERHKLLQQHRSVPCCLLKGIHYSCFFLRVLFGPTKTFDGIMLCLPDKLSHDQTRLEALHSVDNSKVELTITFKHRKNMVERSTTQFYNILFRKIMKTLKMVEMNRNFYDPVAAMMVPQHKLEIWPGYVTAVHEYEGGVMLCLDISHKVMYYFSRRFNLGTLGQ